MSNFRFQEDGHKYFLDDRELPGVTTIIGIADFGKGDQLIQWSANQSTEYILKNLSEDIAIGSPRYKEILKESRTAWKKTRNKAGDIGSLVHKMVEIYVKYRIKKEEIKFDLFDEAILELQKEGKNTDGLDRKQAEAMFFQFTEWEKEDNITFLLSEQKVYSRIHWYAGTVDLVFEKDGKVYLGDLKTAINIFLSNFTQMGGYDICLEELGKIRVCAGYCVINIPKILDKEGKAFRRVKYDTDVNAHKDAFFNCLDLYRYNKKNKNKYGTTRATKTGIKKVIKI